MLKCDFCLEEPPKWRYPATSFIANELDLELIAGTAIDELSKGDWSACEVCHHLIERDDRTALALRAVESMIKTMPELARPWQAKILLSDMRLLHADFFANRTGPAEPLSLFEAEQTALEPEQIDVESQEQAKLIVTLADAGCTLQQAQAFLQETADGPIN